MSRSMNLRATLRWVLRHVWHGGQQRRPIGQRGVEDQALVRAEDTSDKGAAGFPHRDANAASHGGEQGDAARGPIATREKPRRIGPSRTDS